MIKVISVVQINLNANGKSINLISFFFKYNHCLDPCAFHTFAVETFFKGGESAIATERAFRAHLMLRQSDAVLD